MERCFDTLHVQITIMGTKVSHHVTVLGILCLSVISVEHRKGKNLARHASAMTYCREESKLKGKVKNAGKVLYSVV